MRPRLVVFDVDGTISDSQGDILAAMGEAFAAVDQPAPARTAVLGIVGLSLDRAIPALAPDLDEAAHETMIAAYKDAYQRRRLAGGAEGSPLYPGMREVIEGLADRPDVLLGVATGKSMRGLSALLETKGLARHFVTLQCADHHPSKPHPSMLLTAMAETGAEPARSVMIGDTSYDIDMARAAGMHAIAVGWGYHGAAALRGADAFAETAGALPGLIDGLIAPEDKGAA